MTDTDRLLIRKFEPGDAEPFRQLNVEWMSRYFRLEPKDEPAFADPKRSMLVKGERILFSSLAGDFVGCCALVPMGQDTFEVARWQ